MTNQRTKWPALVAMASLVFLSSLHQSCGRRATRGPDGELVQSCDEQIEELKRWLAYISGYNQHASWGQRNYAGDLVEVDLDLAPVMGITPFAIRDDRFETCRKNKVVFEKPESQVEKFREIAHDCRNTRITLYISPEAGWESITRVCEGLMRAGIFEIYFVFEDSEQFNEKPKDSTFGREMASIIAKANESNKPGRRPIFPEEELFDRLKECPRMKNAFRGFEKRSLSRRIMLLDSRLAEAMEECDCTPSIDYIKTVIWPVIWVGQQRLSLLMKLALPGTEDCHEIAQDCILPWSEAHKAVVQAAKDQKGKKLWAEIYKGKPLCFVSRALSPDKIAPMKFELPMIEARKARKKSLGEQLLEEEIKQLKDQIQVKEGLKKADLLFSLAERYYDKYRLIQEEVKANIDKYDMWLGEWGKTREERIRESGLVWAKAAFDIYRILLKNYKKYPRRDEVLFVFAHSLMETGEKQEGFERYRQLIKGYPSSRYIIDAYLAIGCVFR